MSDTTPNYDTPGGSIVLNILITYLIAASAALAVGPTVSPSIGPAIGVVVEPDDGGAAPFYGLTFDGGDYVSMTNATSAGAFDFGVGSFYIAMWIYPTSLASYHILFNKSIADNSPAEEITIYLQGTDVIFRLRDGTNAQEVTTGGGAITTNQWQHIICVVDRATDKIRLYVNGVLKNGEQTLTAVLATDNTGPLRVGMYDVAGYYIGKLADYRVGNGVSLSNAQAAALAANTRPYTVNHGETWASALQFDDVTTPTRVVPHIGTAQLTIPGGANTPTATVSDIRLPPTRF
jgi:hypothetical protein